MTFDLLLLIYLGGMLGAFMPTLTFACTYESKRKFVLVTIVGILVWPVGAVMLGMFLTDDLKEGR